MSEHTFVICAYRESPYLEECIRSLLAQTVPARILMATSTPNEHIRSLAEKYDIPLSVNQGEGGIARDWNFALSLADTPYVTLAHQDDVYEPEYLAAILEGLRAAKDPIIAFTDYFEVRDGRRVEASQSGLLRIKKLLLSPLKNSFGRRSVWLRRRSLSLGNAICCPAVTYVMGRMPERVFEPGFRSNVDWQTWERLSRLPGEFVYLPRALMGHRVHAGSTTSEVIGGGSGRTQEDYEMLRRFWPAPLAKVLVRFYSKSQNSNRSETAR